MSNDYLLIAVALIGILLSVRVVLDGIKMLGNCDTKIRETKLSRVRVLEEEAEVLAEANELKSEVEDRKVVLNDLAAKESSLKRTISQKEKAKQEKTPTKHTVDLVGERGKFHKASMPSSLDARSPAASQLSCL